MLTKVSASGRIGLTALVGAACLSLAACDEKTEAATEDATSTVEVKADASDTRVRRMQFENFTFVATPKVNDGTAFFTGALEVDGAKINDIGKDFVVFTSAAPFTNVPAQNCTTRKVEVFTGGANCCFGYYLMSACGQDRYAAKMTPDAPGAMGDPQSLGGDAMGVSVNDPSFMYYEPSGQTGANVLSLSGAESPRPTRFIVFDDGLWRPDRPGEFPAVYGDLMREALAGGDAAAAKAITAAYYAVMSGADRQATETALREALPEGYRDLSAGIMADIQNAVDTFAPIENVRVGQ